ncbi:MAG TPA: ABC transporter permease [Thermoanaerobaculia bacterium]|jgi:predicted permease
MAALMQDFRYGIRMIAKSPGFSAVAIAVLALGIGANTAIFSVVHAVLLRPLPFPEPDRIVFVPHVPPPEIFPGRKTFAVSPANYLDWKSQNGVFESMAAWGPDSVALTGMGRPEDVPAAAVAPDFFAVLRIKPLLGRTLVAGEDEPGHRVVVLSEALWKTRFGGNPAAVGSTAVLNGESYTIVGVLPAAQTFPEDARLWIPLVWTAEEKAIRGIHDFEVVARLKPGVTVARAQAEMNVLSSRLAEQYPKDDKGWGAAVIPLHEEIVGDVKPALMVLLGAVGFVLLIACANVANLVLAKTVGRRKEIAVRAALGASRGRIVRQLFAETILLALAGGALGLLLAGACVRMIVGFVGDQLPHAAAVGVNGAVLAFTLGISLVTGVLAGVLPGWRLTGANPIESLKQGGRSDADAGSPAVRGALVAAEVALALMLMVGAGLLVRSLGKLRGVDPGFEPRHLLLGTTSIPDARYPTPEARNAFYENVLERIRALPGVVAAGAINTVPLTEGGSTQPVAIEGAPAATLAEQPEVAVRNLTPGTLAALRIPLRRGRDFTAADSEKSKPVILITEAMARKFWPGQDAVGKRLTLTFNPGVVREVVGVVGDVKLRGVSHVEPIAAVFVPEAQLPRYTMTLVVRTAAEPRSLASAVTAAVQALDPDQPVTDIQTMEQHAGDALTHTRFTMLLLAAFAGLALLLSAIGIYSVLAYAVRRRTREIGIRMALGAQPLDVVRLVVLQGMRPALIGLVIGLAGSLAFGRAVSSLVFGVRPTDPATFGAVAGLLMGVALLACALPARRATRVEPTEALQEN